MSMEDIKLQYQEFMKRKESPKGIEIPPEAIEKKSDK